MNEQTPKEKAIELVAKYKTLLTNNGYYNDTMTAKCCALLNVDEILIIMNEEYFIESEKIKYWQEVKQEIENL
jgi:hypothetical protein